MNIKYVKAAGCWCTTIENNDKQETKYWNTEREARAYIQDKTDKAKKSQQGISKGSKVNST